MCPGVDECTLLVRYLILFNIRRNLTRAVSWLLGPSRSPRWSCSSERAWWRMQWRSRHCDWPATGRSYRNTELHQGFTFLLLSLSLSHTHTHTNTWIHAYSRWHDYTNTRLLSVDSWVWPKLPRRGRLLCWRTRTFQRWRGTNTCPGWSQGAWRSNQNTNQIQSQELEECSTYNVHILFIFHYNSTSTILFRNGFVSLSSDRINFMKSL